MTRLLCALMLLAPAATLAASPDFSNGAVTFGLQYGAGLWNLDRAQLGSQVALPAADVFISDAQDTHTASVRLGYNILGHATLEADLTATGWNLNSPTRGGAGFLVGLAHWHPLELVWRKQIRPVPVDASLFFGAGYGIAGQNTGMDGLLYEAGATATYFVSRAVGIGAFARGIFLGFDNFYYDYYGRAQPGATVPLPERSGGSFWTFGISLDLRFET